MSAETFPVLDTNTRLLVKIFFLIGQHMNHKRLDGIAVHPTPPIPTRAALEAGLEHFSSILVRTSQSMKSSSRLKGTVEEGSGVSPVEIQTVLVSSNIVELRNHGGGVCILCCYRRKCSQLYSSRRYMQ